MARNVIGASRTVEPVRLVLLADRQSSAPSLQCDVALGRNLRGSCHGASAECAMPNAL